MLIDDAGRRLSVEVSEPCSVLDVLQAQRVDIRATCGGVGKCGRCQVLVRDDEGLNYRLACMTPVSDGMEVVVERAGIMEVLQSETGDPKYRPHPLLRKMVRGGLLGVKSGKGFFTYDK